MTEKLILKTQREATVQEVVDLIYGTGALQYPWWHSVEDVEGGFHFRFDDPEHDEGTFKGRKMVTYQQILDAAAEFLAEGRGGEDAAEAISDSIGYLDATAADDVLQRAVLGKSIYG